MQAWLLALLVLIVVCAIGAYYVHNTSSGIYDGKEGYSGDPTVNLKKSAQVACETDYTTCLEKGIPNKTCTTAYNVCNTEAQALDKAVSTTSAPGSSTSLSSAPAALAYAKGLGMTGAGGEQNAIDWKNTDATGTYSSPNPDSSLAALKAKIDNGYVPNASNVNAAQGGGFFDELEEGTMSLYSQKIKPHQTPSVAPSMITANLRSDAGTGADAGQGGGLSLRSQIRNDIKKAVRDQFEEIDNEYEVKYE